MQLPAWLRRTLAPLRRRVFLASALVALASVAVAGQVVSARVGRELDVALRRALERSARLVERQQAAREREAQLTAHLVADLPRLKAAVATGDPPTVQPVAGEYRDMLRADLVLVTDARGATLAALGARHGPAGAVLAPAVAVARAGREHAGFAALPGGGILRVVSVPISIGPPPADVLGTLSLGFALDDALAADFRALTDSEVAFTLDGRVRASSLPRAHDAALAHVGAGPPVELSVDGHEYLARAQSLSAEPGAPWVVILQSRSERRSFLHAFRTGLGVAALVALAVGVALSYAVARSVTRPLGAISAAMRELAASGDLRRRSALPGRWDDEEARLLARTFDGLAASLERMQREAAVRQRLSALGQVAAVIAHEVRNPLMIIKSSLPALRGAAAGAEVREAADDIDREVARLNGIVTDVLDSVREARVDELPLDLLALCRDAVAAALPGGAPPEVELDVPPDLPTVRGDSERLRRVLVALLTNAREALGERAHDPALAPQIALRVRVPAEGGVSLEVEDRGPGFAPGDLERVFEPYFTTKRTGTGLGLAIARTMVEALGGSLSAENRPGGGARLRLLVPDGPRPGGAP